jgi:dolichol-phosphate mannosyltransferase
MPASADTAIVIPTFNESGNIPPLLAALNTVLPDGAEVIFVDDSTDATPAVIAEAAADLRFPVRVVHRETPEGGLGGAVLEGLRQARSRWIVVMDADLQHPPDLLPVLLRTGEESGAQFVVASRYAEGGSRAGLSGPYRLLVSWLSTRVTKLAFPRLLRDVSDPMSGFFAVRQDLIAGRELRPNGYKILLELLVRTRPDRIAEVPYVFGERGAERSKSSLREGLRFLWHLTSLRRAALLREPA